MAPQDLHDDEKAEAEAGSSFKDFDCPLCNANNPYDDGFTVGEEIRCFYCGAEFRVSVDDSGRLRLKEV
jgi:transcription elongation factor Elf1